MTLQEAKEIVQNINGSFECANKRTDKYLQPEAIRLVCEAVPWTSTGYNVTIKMESR